MRNGGKRKLKPLFAASGGKNAWKPRLAFEWRFLRDFWQPLEGAVFQARLLGDSALCGVRPETLSLDSATFEKVDETFNMRFA